MIPKLPTQFGCIPVAILAIVAVGLGITLWVQLAALEDADFYECEPNATLVVCKTGTGPPAGECKSVGSGQTTIAPRDCG